MLVCSFYSVTVYIKNVWNIYFQDYESDFEEYESEESSMEQKSETDSEVESLSDEVIQTTEMTKKPVRVEEERKLDSGSYHLTTHADSYRTKQIQDIKNAIMKENSRLNILR